MKKAFTLLLGALFLFVSSCGTWLKPEQKNKPHSDQMDITVVVLDSLGLLLFLIPGIVSFVIDHNNGTLYLPGGKTAHLDNFDPETIQKALYNNGYKVKVEDIKKSEIKANLIN